MNPYEVRTESLKQLGFESYDDYLKSDLWRGIREIVLSRDKGECVCCTRAAIQVHHTDYCIEAMEGRFLYLLESLCGGCHHRIEFDRKGNKTTLAQANRSLRKLKKFYAALHGGYLKPKKKKSKKKCPWHKSRSKRLAQPA